ncbi:hypothetical protein [Nocardia sp. NPDC127526]|uniref:hypothetical protein n=1 Tax=Nocardia sp. NPDC127526 TaxID=3345393 RepID=UPI0036323788
MSRTEVDEASRSYQQLMKVVMRLAYQYSRTLPRGQRLTREQYMQFQREIEERVRLDQYERAVTLDWYKARVADYQREAADLAARHRAGAISDEERLRETAYLQGMRAGIENTVHSAAKLTPEERGQVVQALDAIDADPKTRMEHGVFGPMTKREKAVARQVAARSEAAALKRTEDIEARKQAAAEAPLDASATFSELKQANARLTKQVHKLTADNTALQAQVTALEAQLGAKATAGADASTNGHGTQRADQQAQHAEQQGAQADIDPDHGDGGAAAQMEAEA